MKLASIAAAAGACCLLPATAVAAPVVPSTALQAAEALTTQNSLVTSANWVLQPKTNGGSEPAPTVAVANGPLLGFPTAGSRFLVVSSGDALNAEATNLSGYHDGEYENAPGTEAHWEGAGRANDLTILHVAINVPSNANCLALDFRFLSEEYPQYVGEFDDAVLVELDEDNWKIREDDASFDAPANFATDSSGNPLSVNSTGSLALSPEGAEGSGFAGEAGGEAFGGGTALLGAETAVTPGTHDLYVSVFDAGDHALDTGALMGNLRTFNATSCPRGAVAASEVATPAPETITPPHVAGTPEPGQTLSASTEGAFGGEGITYTYQWLLDGKPIAGATEATYTVGAADEGHQLSVTVTATNTGGEATQTSTPVTIPLRAGRTVPVSGASTPTKLPVPASTSTTECRSTRSESIHWKTLRGVRLRNVVVRVDGKVYRRLAGGARGSTVSLAGRGRGPVVVTITGISAAGRRYSDRRTYRPCTPGHSTPPLGSLYLRPS